MPQTKTNTYECPSCYNTAFHKVVNTEMAPDNRLRRRRECSACGGRFTTYEIIVSDLVKESAYEAGFLAGRQSVADYITNGD